MCHVASSLASTRVCTRKSTVSSMVFKYQFIWHYVEVIDLAPKLQGFWQLIPGF